MKKPRDWNARVQMIRTALRLTSTEMARELHMGVSGYSSIESGKNAISPRVEGLLIEKFNVNPAWLRSGQGEMFRSGGPKQAQAYDHLVVNDISKSALLARIADLERELEQKNNIIDALLPKRKL
jgi:transcriptional regulator with XRE-family HTH domain